MGQRPAGHAPDGDRRKPSAAPHGQHPPYYLHRPDPDTPLEDSLATIKEHHDAGTIRHVGVSNVAIDQIEQARAVVPITAVQNSYSLSERHHEDVVDYCATEGIAFVPYFPLRADADTTFFEIAKRHNAANAQIALAWLLKRSPTMLPIPGTLSLDHQNRTSPRPKSNSATQISRPCARRRGLPRDRLGAARQHPVRPREVAGVAVRIRSR